MGWLAELPSRGLVVFLDEVATRSAINRHRRDGYRRARIAIDPAIAARGI
jgi:hypothetical protein